MQFFQKHRRLLLFVALPILILLIISLLVLPRFISTAYTAGGPAPRGSWTTSSWAPSNNSILGTAPNTTSDVWFTGYDGIISEVFYPRADIPDTTALQFLVGDSNHAWVDEERTGTTSHAQLYDNHSLAWTFERIDDDGNPNDGALITIGNHGGVYDEREVVEMGFLELVRQGVMPATSPYITTSLAVVDATISQAINGNRYWFRYNHDGYGEDDNGSAYDGSGIGRLWPLLSGERGIYTIAAGGDADAYLSSPSMSTR